MDVVCNRGFTFAYYIQIQPTPKEYLDMGLLPLHSKVFALFYSFKDEYHKVNFDNLYSSAKFSFAAYVKRKKKVKKQGGCQGGSGIQPHVTQVK